MPTIPRQADIIVLAGDIVTPKYHAQLANFCKSHTIPVILITGNHCYYGGDIATVNAALKDMEKAYPNFHHLNNATFAMDGVVIHGTTLWSDFMFCGEHNKPNAMFEALHGINDFRKIRHGNRLFTPNDMVKLHAESRLWLSESLTTHRDMTNVVVSHFPPHRLNKNPHFQPNILDAYFNNDMSDIIDNNNISHWLYGHNHYSNAQLIGNTTYVSNQRGYGNENTGYDERLIIDVD